MPVMNALAGIATKDLEKAVKWYEPLIGRTGRRPMEGVVEWSLPRGGGLQVFVDPKRAGSSTVTLSVEGLDAIVAELSARGVAIGDRTRSEMVSTAIVRDPDGNQVVLAEPHSGDIAR